MGAGGRPPKPASVHLLNGNPSKLSPAALASGPAPATAIPDAPEWLLGEARAEWERITPELEKLGLVSNLDVAHLAGYCQAYALMARAGAEIKRLQAEGENDPVMRDPMRGLVDRTPSGYKQISALMQVYNRACESMKQHAAEFGLSPSARMRVKPDAAQGSLFPDSDPMDAFLRATGAA